MVKGRSVDVIYIVDHGWCSKQRISNGVLGA